MGCGGSKSTSADEGATVQTTPAASDSPAEPTQDSSPEAAPAQAPESSSSGRLTKEDALSHVEKCLAISGERAQRIVDAQPTDSEGTVDEGKLNSSIDRVKELKEKHLSTLKEQDEDGSGHVTQEAGKSALSGQIEGITDVVLFAIITRLCKEDAEAKIHCEELLEFCVAVQCKKEALEVRFHALDADKSGDLDMGELLNTVMQEASVDEEQARTFIKECDVDNSGTIDTDEFIAMWIKLKR